MKKHNKQNFWYYVFIALIVLFLISLVIDYLPSKIQLSPGKEPTTLIISDLSNSEEILNEKCNLIVEGFVSNIGKSPASETVIKCSKATYPLPREGQEPIELTKYMGQVKTGEKVSFKINHTSCEDNLRIECKASCGNC
ncbi:MAG: hypothetical protein ABIB79_02720 [archaeon]